MEMRGGFVQIHPGKQACLVVQSVANGKQQWVVAGDEGGQPQHSSGF